MNSHKPKKVRRVWNAAAKLQEIVLNEKPLSDPDLLHSVININFRLREHQISLSANKEPMFLQASIPSDDSQCLYLLFRGDSEHKMQVYEYTRHVFAAKSSPTCSKYALHPKWRKIVQSTTNVLSKQFSKISTWTVSIRSAEEAIEIY